MDKRIVDFLIRAKKATYAGKGAETESSRPGSHDLIYREDDLMYYDTYLGGDKFAGEEAIWVDGKIQYAMNYLGRVLEQQFSGDFLKEALRKADKKMPYRGPEYYHAGEYTYRCKVTGDFTWFQGYEEIYRNETKTYECVFHGGTLR